MYKNYSLKMLFRLAQLMSDKGNRSLIQIGEELTKLDADSVVGPGGFWIWDTNSTCEYYSPNFLKSLEVPESEVNYTTELWISLITPEGLRTAEKALDDVLSVGGQYYCEVEYKTRSGKPLRVICSGVLIYEEGQPHWLIGTHQII